MNEVKKFICKYVLEMHRSSDIEGGFTLTEDNLKVLKELDGFEFRYGEIAGKYSDVRATFYVKDIEIVSEDQNEVKLIEKLFPYGQTGFPFTQYWLDDSIAYDAGYGCADDGEYESAEEALTNDYAEYNNSIMRDSFTEGFNSCKQDELL